MGIRTGRPTAPLAAALLLTLAACASPPATSGSAPSSPDLLTRTALSTAVRPPTTTPRTTTAEAPTSVGARPTITAGPTAPVTSGVGPVVPSLPSCSAATLPTAAPGTLTFVLSNRAAAPWVIGDPAQAQGFEAAVGAAVARRLGFSDDQVVWKTADPTQVQGARVAGADVGLGEIRVPDQGSGAVDYSTGYFSISDSVVARIGTPAAKATGLPALQKLRVAALIGPAAGTGRLNSPARAAYPTAPAALAALRSGSVDVAVIPTPAAVTAGSDIAVVGQLSLPTEQPAQFGMVLPKNSKLTACVSAAIDQLRVTGALTKLVQRWVPAANKPLR